MLESLRNFLTGPRLFIVIACCALPFVFLGTSSLSTAFGGSLGTINGEDVTESDFQVATNITIQQFKSVYGEDFDFNMLDEETQLDQIKQQLIVQKVLLSNARNFGMINKTSEKEAKKSIIKNPAFQVDGIFNESVFEAQVNSTGQTKDEYIELTSKLMAAESYRSAVSSISFATQQESLDLAMLLEQTIDIDFIKIDFDALKQNISNTDDELTQYYSDNQILFYSDEKRSFSYIILSADNYEDKVVIPEDYLENAYSEYLSKANERSQTRISHIMVDKSNHATSEEAYAVIESVNVKLDSGESFSELVATFSDDFVSRDTGGDLEYYSADIFPVEFGEAIKGLSIGDTSSIVEIDESFHILKVTELTEAEILPLSEVEDKFITELVSAESVALMNDDFIELDDMISSNSSIESIGDALTQDIFSSKSFTASNFTFDINDTRIVDYIFSSESEIGVAEAIELDNSFIILSINNIEEASLISYENVKDTVASYLSDIKAVEKKSLLVEQLNLAKSNETFNEFISDYSFIIKDSFVEVGRNSSLMPPEILSELFKYSPLETVSMDSNNGDMYMVDVLKLNQPSDDDIDKLLEEYQNFAEQKNSQMMSDIINKELFDSARVNLTNSAL